MYVGTSYIIRVMHSGAEREFHNTPDGFQFLVLPTRAIQALTQISFFCLQWEVQVNIQYATSLGI